MPTDCQQWLTDYLYKHGGTAMAANVLADGRKKGFSDYMIRQSKDKLPIDAVKTSRQEDPRSPWKWVWRDFKPWQHRTGNMVWENLGEWASWAEEHPEEAAEEERREREGFRNRTVAVVVEFALERMGDDPDPDFESLLVPLFDAITDGLPERGSVIVVQPPMDIPGLGTTRYRVNGWEVSR